MPDPTPLGPPADSGAGRISPQNPTALGPPTDAGSGLVLPDIPTALGPPADAGSGWVGVAGGSALGPPAEAGSGWAAAAMILDVSPPEVVTTGGTTVTLTGPLLGTVTALTVAGSPVSVTVVDATTITFTAPAHAVGSATIAATAPSGSPTATLTYYAPLTVATMTPTTGTTLGGTVVTFTGTGFTGVSSVTFDGTPGTGLSVIDDNNLTVNTPPHAAGAVPVVLTNTHENTSGDPETFTFVTISAAPTITSVTPDSSPIGGGTNVTIIGTGFSGLTGFTVDGVSVSRTVVSDTEIRFTAPAHAVGTVSIRVTTPSGVATHDFTYYRPITITSIAPPSGPPLGGTTVKIIGSGFTGAFSVTFGGSASTNYEVVSDSLIYAVSPPNSVGVVDVRVTNPRGTSPNTSADNFEYRPAPTITDMDPIEGPTSGGVTVRLTGSDLDDVTSLTIDETVVAIIPVDASTIEFIAPPHAVGDVIVAAYDANGSGASPPTRFTYYTEVTVTAVSPAVGSVDGGQTVTVTGTGFSDAIGVAFGVTAGTSIEIISDTELTVVTPPQALGTVEVRVTNPRGTSPLNPPGDNFTYAPIPTITLIDPAEGSVVGGTEVTVTGSNLTGVTTIMFGANPAFVVEFIDDTTVIATTPIAAAPGDVAVVAVTPAGESVDDITFTYTNQPPIAVAAASPTSGQAILTVDFFSEDTTDPDGGFSIASYHWDFGDGTESSGSAPTHSYLTPGIYTATLTVTDIFGATGTDTVTITVTADPGNTAPVAIATANPVSGDLPLLVRFVGTGSFDPDIDGSIVRHQWDFGDGSPPSYAPSLNHIYYAAGTYTATLTVIDNKGGVGVSDPIEIVVGVPETVDPPVITSISPDTGSTEGGTPVLIRGLHLLGVTQVIFERVGDEGSWSAEILRVINDNYISVLSPPGYGLVNVRARNSAYTSTTSPDTLYTYMSPPTAVASASPMEGYAPLDVSFSSAGSWSPRGILAYFWTFGDGSTLDLGDNDSSNEPNPTHTYDTPGAYTVTLTITDRAGIIATAELVIHVLGPPGPGGGGGGTTPDGGGGGPNGGGNPGGNGGGGDDDNPPSDPIWIDFDCSVDSAHQRRGITYWNSADPIVPGDFSPLFSAAWSTRRLRSGVLFTVTVNVLRDYLPSDDLLHADAPYPVYVYFGAISMTSDGGFPGPTPGGTTSYLGLVRNPRVVGTSGLSLSPQISAGGLFTPLINDGTTGITAGMSFTLSGMAPPMLEIAYAQVGFLSQRRRGIGDTDVAWVAVECEIEDAPIIGGWTITDPNISGSGGFAIGSPPPHRPKHRQ